MNAPVFGREQNPAYDGPTPLKKRPKLCRARVPSRPNVFQNIQTKKNPGTYVPGFFVFKKEVS